MNEKRRKSVVMSVRFTPDEFMALTDLAARRGMPISAYMREVALRPTPLATWKQCGMCDAAITDNEYRTIRTVDEIDNFTGRRVRLFVHAHEHHFAEAVPRSA